MSVTLSAACSSRAPTTASSATYRSMQFREETRIQYAPNEILIQRVTHLEELIVQMEAKHAQTDMRMLQTAFKAARESSNVKKQLELSQVMLATRDVTIAQLESSLAHSNHMIESSWEEIATLTDDNEIERNRVADLTTRIDILKMRIADINQKLTKVQIAFENQKRLTELIAERQKLKILVDDNVTCSGASGLIAGIASALFISPHCFLPVAAGTTFGILSDKKSTDANLRMREVNVDINTLIHNLQQEDELEETTLPTVFPVDPIDEQARIIREAKAEIKKEARRKEARARFNASLPALAPGEVRKPTMTSEEFKGFLAEKIAEKTAKDMADAQAKSLMDAEASAATKKAASRRKALDEAKEQCDLYMPEMDPEAKAKADREARASLEAFFNANDIRYGVKNPRPMFKDQIVADSNK
jgi:hypothetical protein